VELALVGFRRWKIRAVVFDGELSAAALDVSLGADRERCARQAPECEPPPQPRASFSAFLRGAVNGRLDGLVMQLGLVGRGGRCDGRRRDGGRRFRCGRGRARCRRRGFGLRAHRTVIGPGRYPLTTWCAAADRLHRSTGELTAWELAHPVDLATAGQDVER